MAAVTAQVIESLPPPGETGADIPAPDSEPLPALATEDIWGVKPSMGDLSLPVCVPACLCLPVFQVSKNAVF